MNKACRQQGCAICLQDAKPVPEAVKQGVESVGKDVGALPGEICVTYGLVMHPC